jgi:hypothetical protein
MQNTHSLKVGDKVRALVRWPHWFNEGDTLTIKEVGEEYVYIDATVSSFKHGGFFPKKFVKIETAPAKYRVTETDKSGLYLVQRRVEHWHNLTNAATKAEAESICATLNTLNAAEVA